MRHPVSVTLGVLWILAGTSSASTNELRIGPAPEHAVEVVSEGVALLRSPREGLWSVATGSEGDWPSAWSHAHPTRVEEVGDWTVLHGELELEAGRLEVRDAYREERGWVRGLRRFTWRGEAPLERCHLALRWTAPGSAGARPLLPGINYYGNPSGGRQPDRVPLFGGAPEEWALYEEHRYPMPFACVEWGEPGALFGAALHTLPSRVRGGRHADQWWSLGLRGVEGALELVALSGACATNGERNVVKAQQGRRMDYPEAWIRLRPGEVIEKTFFLQAFPVAEAGSAFEAPTQAALELHRPYELAALPSLATILERKLAFAESRFRDGPGAPGFEMYPEWVEGTHYVMGWCGQAAAAPYAYLVLAERRGDAALVERAARALDHLATSPFDEHGFLVRYDAESDHWSGQDPVSQGQGMENFALAIEAARRLGGVDTSRWEAFLRRACAVHAERILAPGWRPRSTAEAFLVSPLLHGARLFDSERFRRAALFACEHYAERHSSMVEPYWGGTLDASCEDKEGAWAALQAFLAAYEDGGEARHLRWAEHALNVMLTYVVVWDVEMPPGRLADHAFRSRGWTAVSPQNEHLDAYGVLATPAVYRMGRHLNRPELTRLAAVMYRSCGQLIDPYGSQGEQIQQTNYAQQGDMSDLFALRGQYSEGWTVFWITAHFLVAAAQFEELDVDLDALDSPGERTAPAPLFRDPVFDGAADPVLVWNRARGTWWMLYTQRRAKLDLPGVEWCHGTEIGVAESRDLGNTWDYRGTLDLSAHDEAYSFWAPDVVEHGGRYHLFVSYVPGMHADWSGERHILHYRSRDLVHWDAAERIELGSERCIDPSVVRTPSGRWRMWFKDEGRASATLAVESDDLETWTAVADPGVSRLYGEAPKVFHFAGCHWMLKDPNDGLDVYRSVDLEQWEYQGKILDRPGRRNDDGSIGKHADVVVSGGRAFVFYFTHPEGQDYPLRDGIMPRVARRSSLQVAELCVRAGVLTCDRDAAPSVRLLPLGAR